MVAYETRFNIIFEKPGKLELLYKKDTSKDLNGKVSGTVNVYIDQNNVLKDEEIDGTHNDWKLFTTDI
jgi:hypothetical protein